LHETLALVHLETLYLQEVIIGRSTDTEPSASVGVPAAWAGIDGVWVVKHVV
jgi:hypothetical protein